MASDARSPHTPGRKSDEPRPDLQRQDAVSKVRQAMASAVGLIPVTTAAAHAICDVMSAAQTTVILIDKDYYWDVADVWVQRPEIETSPKRSRYPISEYPVGTERLMAGRGYFSGDAVDEALIEVKRLWPSISVGSIMGVPIIALGEIHGEIFLMRDEASPPFSRDDLDVVAELAPLVGARLPALLANYADDDPKDADGASLMPRLATRFKDFLQ
ncbi:MAG: GAF domain-containing protein [Candidatus Nanopelagicales bacterium]